MNSVAAALPTPAEWRADVLFRKAQRYAEKMENADDWEEVLWSGLALELLARSALAAVNPVLLADPEKWQNAYHALGFTPTAAKFSPKSISITAVLARLNEILPQFTQEHQSFCTLHVGRRNAELHSGDTPFDGLLGSSWKPDYFRATKALLASVNLALADYLTPETAVLAETLIAAADDKAGKAVSGDIEAHKRVWEAKDTTEQAALTEQTVAWASKTHGHRAKCPACGCNGLIFGEPVSPPAKVLDGDMIVETQTFLPSRFECIACRLKVTGLARLHAARMADTFKRTQEYEASEFYATDDPEPEWEPDYND